MWYEILEYMINEIFQESLGLFLLRESSNITSGVSERNLCGRLAMALEAVSNERGLHGYYADTEYNRKQDGRIKTILDDGMVEVVINSDLILHSRGEIIARDNLIAIEMKKANRPEAEKVSDRARLRAMTKTSYDDVWSYDGITHPEYVCGYELGVFIELDSKRRTIRVEHFKNGNFIHANDAAF